MYKKFGSVAGLILGAISILIQGFGGLFIGVSFLSSVVTIFIYLLACTGTGFGIGSFIDFLWNK